MDDTYKLVEIVGTSTESFSQAVRNGVARASKTLEHVNWVQVTDMRGRVANGEVVQFQATMKVGFKLEE